MNADEFIYQYYNQLQFKWKWEKRNLTVNFAHGLELMYEVQITGRDTKFKPFQAPFRLYTEFGFCFITIGKVKFLLKQCDNEKIVLVRENGEEELLKKDGWNEEIFESVLKALKTEKDINHF